MCVQISVEKKTVTTLRIFATLVHPDETVCLKTATFVSNTPMNRNLSSSTDGLDFTYGYNRNTGAFSWGGPRTTARCRTMPWWRTPVMRRKLTP